MGIDRYVYAAGDTSWIDTFMERIEKQSKGYNAVSLSNYDATAVCVITDGSVFEVAGSMYLCTADTSITVSCATGICYIMATGATATASVAWSTAAPVWRDDLQGYYASAASVVRAIGGTYFDGSSYELKWAYGGYDSGPQTRKLAVPLVGFTNEATIQLQGNKVDISSAEADDDFYLAVNFPMQEGVIVRLDVYSANVTAGEDFSVSLMASPINAVTTTTMAVVALTNGSTQETDTSIISEHFNQDTNKYYIMGFNATSTNSTLEIEGIEIQYQDFIR